MPRSPEQDAENLYRLIEFRTWVHSNALFPGVPDSIVHPLVKLLREAEHCLVNILYDQQEFERVSAILKATATPAAVGG